MFEDIIPNKTKAANLFEVHASHASHSRHTTKSAHSRHTAHAGHSTHATHARHSAHTTHTIEVFVGGGLLILLILIYPFAEISLQPWDFDRDI